SSGRRDAAAAVFFFRRGGRFRRRGGWFRGRRRFRGFGRRRLGRGRFRRRGRRLGAFGRAWKRGHGFGTGGGRAVAVVAVGDHDHREHEADDHGDQAGDDEAHVAVRLVAVRAAVVGLAHQAGRILVHRLYSSGPSIASRIEAVSSISKPFRRRAAISSRLLPET